MTRDQIAARIKADALMAEHIDMIIAAVYTFGAGGTAGILRALADKIEHGEFERERMH